MKKIKKIFTNWKVWLLILCVFLSLMLIDYQFSQKGITIAGVESNSSAAKAGMETPSSEIKPTERERILQVQNKDIFSLEDFYNQVNSVPEGSTLRIRTNEREYVLLKSKDPLGITVKEAASSNLRKGLDLQGGTRVLLQPEGELSDNDIKDIVSVMEKRLNVYGLSDLSIKSSSDLEGNKFIIVEIAGASKEEVTELIGSQGKFEARIGDELVFSGGKKDITNVCRFDGTCSGVSSCGPSANGYACRFSFEISLSAEAAKRHAEVTSKIPVNTSTDGERILAKTIDFYLDNEMVDSLQVSADLKGQEATTIVISGPGTGAIQQDAVQDALANMHELQTVLITGSLPANVNIVKIDTISPALGKAFVNNILIIMVLAIISVAVVLFIRYRSLKSTLPTMITVISEVIIILGISALLKSNLDIAAIAGMIAAVGTGVNHQIIILDEMINKERRALGSLSQQIKSAFFILFAAFATLLAAMLPLLWAGAGLLTGFAVITIAGATIGVLITRPAFAVLIKIIYEE